MDPRAVTDYLHEHIPLTAHLGAIVESFDGKTIRLFAPLEPNLNHRNTAFGGSISALAILSGWTLLHLKLKEEGICNRLVIQKSSLDFLVPIACDFLAECSLPPKEAWEKFLNTLKRRGLARIRVASRIVSTVGTGGSHEGTYVAVIRREDEPY